MKIRNDFVTNSSSSSFVCEICGESDGGFDVGLSDVDMCECVNGHTICNCHRFPNPSKEIMIKMILENKYNDCSEDELNRMTEDELFEKHLTEGGYYEVPEEVCPICQFIEYSESDLVAYLLKEYGIPRDEVFEEVKKFNKRRKKLYDSEYITYVCKENDLQPAEIVSGWKDRFGTYRKFKDFLRKTF